MIRGPLVPNVGILALVYHQWDWPWMTPHHVLTRLGKYFHVVWVDPAPAWDEMLRRWKKIPVPLVDSVRSPGFRVYFPEFWLPEFYRWTFLRQLTFSERLRRARRLLVQQGCQRIVLYVWHPRFGPALSRIPFDLSCYHIDDEYSFSTVELPQDEAEADLIATVDQVFVTSPGLLAKKGKINPHTELLPEGVDYEAYATPAREPVDMATIPHPRIGYTGFLKKQLDWSLLMELSLRHPQWSFVFVGPRSSHQEIAGVLEAMGSRRNVHFLGTKTPADLPGYVQHFDVCIMPYRLDDYTKYIYPLKLHEYLASGRPVVGSPIRSLLEFSHVIALAQTVEEWSRELTTALAPGAFSPERVESRRRVARNYDWETLIGRIASSVCERLGPTVEAQGRNHGADGVHPRLGRSFRLGDSRIGDLRVKR